MNTWPKNVNLIQKQLVTVICDRCLTHPSHISRSTTIDVKIKTEVDLGTLKSENIHDEKDLQKRNKETVVGYQRKQASLREIRAKERSQMRENRKREKRRKGSFRKNKQIGPGYCNICEKEYTSTKLFELHKYLHKIKSKEFLEKKDCSTGEYICTFCEAKCASMDKLGSHLMSHEEPCKECGTTFPNAFVLGVHLAEHDNEHRICCPYCHYKGSLAHCLKTHLLTRHFKLKIFRCEDCGANYSAKTHLEEHKRFHHEKMDPYVCVVCQRTFIFKTSLQKHQINSHRPLIDGDVPSNFCIICKRTLSTVEALKKHIAEKHAAEKPPKNTERFICDICGKDFSHRQSWLLHTKGHSGLKPYACKLCSKTFRVRAFLTQHEKTHSDEKPFSCEMCGTCFKRKEGLRRHLQTHTDVKPFVCNNCDKSFRRREHLKLHLNSCNRNMAVFKLT